MGFIMNNFNYSVRRKTKSFNDCDYVSYSICSSIPVEKVNKPIDVNGELKRVNTRTGEITDYTLKDFERSKRNSVNRSLRNFEDIAYANIDDWQLFGTLTFAPSKVDRFNDDAVYHLFDLWRKYMKREFDYIKYLAIPERHKSGALHIHLLIGNLVGNELNLTPIRRVDFNARREYRAKTFEYGRNNFSFIEDKERCIQYCKKYLIKDLGISTTTGKHRFYYSKNCAKPKVTSEIVCNIADKSQLKPLVDTMYHNIFSSDFYVSADKNFIIKKVIK